MTKTSREVPYEDHNAIVDAIFRAYIHCCQTAGIIKTKRYDESIYAEDDEVASGQPKVVSYEQKALPRINPFTAKEYIADCDSVFDIVLKPRPHLESTLDAVLHETANLPHDKIDSKKRSALVLYIGKLAARRGINPSTYFRHIRKKAVA